MARKIFIPIGACLTCLLVAAFLCLKAVLYGPFGFIDRSGLLVVDLQQYDNSLTFDPSTWIARDTATSVYAFSGGMAVVEMTNGSGLTALTKTDFTFVDPHGHMLPRRFAEVGHFVGGLAMARSSDTYRCGYINVKGDYVIQPEFQDACDFSENFAAVKLAGKWGYIDNSSKVVIQPRFDQVQQFSQGIAGVKAGQWGFIDTTGRFVTGPKYGEVFPCSEGIAVARQGNVAYDSDGSHGIVEEIYLDTKGKELFKCRIDADAFRPFDPMFIPSSSDRRDDSDRTANTSFSDGLAVIKIGSQFGYIDKSFKIVIPPAFDYAYRFSDGRALVYRGGLFAYIDTSGRQITPYQYRKASSFSEGLAVVCPKDKPNAAGYIDKKGQWAISPKYDVAHPFSEGKAQVGECFEAL